MTELVSQEFSSIYSIINLHRQRALQEVNNDSLLIAWNVGSFVSQKIALSEWGSSVVSELSDYLRTKDPSLKGYSRRTIYKMVQFYDTYSNPQFTAFLAQFKLNATYKLPAPIAPAETQIVPFEMAQMGENEIVPIQLAQFVQTQTEKNATNLV